MGIQGIRIVQAWTTPVVKRMPGGEKWLEAWSMFFPIVLVRCDGLKVEVSLFSLGSVSFDKCLQLCDCHHAWSEC